MWRRSTPTRGSFWLEASGYSLACGSIGEFASLTLEERERVLEETIRAVDGRAMVLGHASATDRSSILRLAQHAARVGAAGVMVLLPYYYRLSDSEILDFFRWLDASIELPFLVYNNPGTTGMNISLQAVGALSELPWFAGLKEASPDCGALPSSLPPLRRPIPGDRRDRDAGGLLSPLRIADGDDSGGGLRTRVHAGPAQCRLGG